MRSRTPRIRRSTGRIAAVAVLVAVVVALLPLAPIAPAPSAQAAVATGGTGAHRGIVDWMQWSNIAGQAPLHGQRLQSGAVATSVRTVGSTALSIRCSLSNIVDSTPNRNDGIYAYRSGTWSGDALDNLYNVGGTGTANQLIYGISNQGTGMPSNPGTMSFDVACSATLGTAAVPLQGLVVADAEQSNNSQGESIAVVPSGPATWRIIETARSGCTTGTTATPGTNNSLTLQSNGAQCSGGSAYGPIAIAFMDGASAGRFSLTTNDANSALAIGVVLASDFGDAPATYGEAGAVFQSNWSGGTVPSTRDAFSGSLATRTGGQPRFGARVDDEGAYQPSSSAAADDATGEDDEDVLFTYRDINGQLLSNRSTLDLAGGIGTSQSITVSCAGAGAVVGGWFDFDRSGTFDADEASSLGSCASGQATIAWTIPADVKPSTSADPTFLRLRIANAGTALAATGLTTSGEVEDHPVGVVASAISATKQTDVPAGAVRTPGEQIRYSVVLANAGRTTLTSPMIADDMRSVLDGASFVEGSASVASSDGAAGSVTRSGTTITATRATALPAGATMTLTYRVLVTDARRGQQLVNVATVTGTSTSGTPISATATTTTDVSVSLRVEKQWRVDGVTYAEGTQPSGLSASATTTDPVGSAASQQAWGSARDGYRRGQTATVAETTTIAAGLSCTLVSATARAGSAAATPLPTTVQLNAATTVVTITNTVTCDTRLTLRNTVGFGSADPSAWTLTATGPTGGVTGASGASGAVRAGDQYALGQSGGDPAYVASAWTCRTTTGEAVVVSNGSFRMPLGKHVECSVVQTTARLTMLKHIDATVPGTIRASDFTLVATPASGSSLPERQTVGAGSAAAVGAAGTNTFEIRPGLGYTLSERSRLAYLGLELQHYPGGMPAGGVLLESNWRAVTSSTITVEPGTHAVYRFVNSPVPVLTLPLTGGVGSVAYLIGGAALLLAALAFVLYRSRKRPRGGLA